MLFSRLSVEPCDSADMFAESFLIRSNLYCAFYRFHDHTFAEFLRLRSYNHLLFNPTLTLLPPGGLGVAGGSENMLESKELVLALKFELRLALRLALSGLGDPCDNDRRPL